MHISSQFKTEEKIITLDSIIQIFNQRVVNLFPKTRGRGWTKQQHLWIAYFLNSFSLNGKKFRSRCRDQGGRGQCLVQYNKEWDSSACACRSPSSTSSGSIFQVPRRGVQRMQHRIQVDRLLLIQSQHIRPQIWGGVFLWVPASWDN